MEVLHVVVVVVGGGGGGGCCGIPTRSALNLDEDVGDVKRRPCQYQFTVTQH